MADTTGTARRAVAEEQRVLEAAHQRRDELIAELSDLRTDDDGPATGADGRVAAARTAARRRRLAELEQADSGLVFGRLDTLDGHVRRIGRTGLPSTDPDGDPLVLDWRADAARPFYTATPLDPQGVAVRRHVRTEGRQVTGVDDEPLADGTPTDGLVGEAALLDALGRRRTGHMGTAVATLQREQDAVVRAPADGALVVQGGPGTGKTVVALHRVAYLLFSHPHLADRGVLLVGPSARFLEYVGQVLPALGETQVVSTTCDRLVPGVVPTRTDDRAVTEIKGRVAWLDGLARWVDARVPRPRELTFVVDGDRYVLSRRQVADVVSAARAGRSFHAARCNAGERVRALLVDAVVDRAAELLVHAESGFEDVLARVDASLVGSDEVGERTVASGAEVDGVLSDADVEALEARIAADPQVTSVLDEWWPVLDAEDVLRELLDDAAALRRYVGLTAAEARAVVRASADDDVATAEDWGSSVAPRATDLPHTPPARPNGAPTSPEWGTSVARGTTDVPQPSAHAVVDATTPDGRPMADARGSSVARGTTNLPQSPRLGVRDGTPRPGVPDGAPRPGWSSADVPLLDAVAELLGDATPAARPDGAFLAERAAGQRDWAYGHVVVDEAQELSAMEWAMLLRRCPTRSFTIVGDVDQTSAPHGHRTWAEALAPTFGDRWRQAELTVAYRTPREVMALTADVLARAGSTSTPPRAVRSSGVEPWEVRAADGEVGDVVGARVRELVERYAGGTVGVVAPSARVPGLTEAVPDGVPVLSPLEAKGLEFDAVVVVDPDGIAAGPRGWNALYVALTRCTQELGRVVVA